MHITKYRERLTAIPGGITAFAARMGIPATNVYKLLSGKKNLHIVTIERMRAASGGKLTKNINDYLPVSENGATNQ